MSTLMPQGAEYAGAWQEFIPCIMCVADVYIPAHAGVAQLVEQLTCNQQVAGSIPVASSTGRLGRKS